MTEIILVGAGGCMRELAWQIMESNRIEEKWKIVGYVDRFQEGDTQDVMVGDYRIPYLGDDDYLLQSKKDVNVVLSVGNSGLRKRLANMYQSNPKIHFPNLILDNAKVCSDLKAGCGCIISMDVKVSTNVKLGNFVFINMDSTICHDGVVEDFVSINPDVTLAGAVTIGQGSEIGLGAKVIQGVTVGHDVVIGAGSVIIKDTESECTIVGVPGRKVRG